MLIEFLDDWYLYTFAIADPESFIWIIEYLKSHFNLSISNRIEDTKLIKDNVFMAMETYLENMIKICEPIYCYSISEYNQFKHLFSLGSNRNEIKRLKEKIKRRVSFDC